MTFRRLFRIAVRSDRITREDAEAELQSFVAARVDQLIAHGWSPADARTEALRRLGGTYERALADTVVSAQQRERRMSYRNFFEGVRDDIRVAARGLRREKALTTYVVLTLALGIGANAAMFGLVDRLLVRGPEHIQNPSRVMRFYRTVHRDGQREFTGNSFGWVSYDIFRKNTRSFDAVAGYAVNIGGFTFGRGTDAVLVPFGAVSHDFFPLLGVQPALGRFFTADEDEPGKAQPVVVIGYNFWQRSFAGDRNVVGLKTTLGGTEYSIIGVAPRGFTGPQLSPVDAWIPLSLTSANVTTNWTTAWNAQWIRIIARVKRGVTPQQAADDATAAYRGAYTGTDATAKVANLWVAPMNFDASGKETVEVTISRWLVGVAAIVLLIACANVANLLLARAIRRRREVAVRIALGAGRARLVRLLLAESLMLSMSGAAAGLVVAWAVAKLTRGTLLPGLEWPSSAVDGRVLGISIAMALLVGLVIGIVPALRASRPNLTMSLKAGAREGGGQTYRLRSALTVAQAALSIVLLIGAGLFVRSLSRIRAVDLGIEPQRVLVAQIRYGRGALGTSPEGQRRSRALSEALDRARALPMVERASITIGLPFQTSFGQFIRVAGWDSVPASKGGTPNINAVADNYFETVGTKLIEGRTFEPSDRSGSEPVAIVNAAMVKTLWEGKSPIGQCLYWSVNKDSLNTCSRIIGVVATAHTSSIREEPAMQYYIPLGHERGFGGSSLIVRPKPGHAADAAAALRKLINDVDPEVTYVQVQTLQQSIDPQVRPWRLGATLFTLMGVLALLVAAIGLYSVMSYLVAQRTQEIGVRIALGAQSWSIVGLILRSSASMAIAGVIIGVAIALGAGGRIKPLLFNTSPHDPLVLGGVAATLILVALVASIVPAMRAKRVHPMEALKSD